MGKSTHIYNKFTGYYSAADCSCTYCLYWNRKKRGCTLDKCCCEEERVAAHKNEHAMLKAVKVKRRTLHNAACDE